MEQGTSIRSTIDRYKKAHSESSNTATITEINAQYYQQESAKLRQQIQMLQNSNRHLMGDSLSSLSVKELKQLENRLERGITRIRSKKHELLLAEIEYMQKKEVELENESFCLRTRIAEIERMEQANTVPAQEMDAIQVLASRNFFPLNMMDGGNSYNPDKKLHLGQWTPVFQEIAGSSIHMAEAIKTAPISLSKHRLLFIFLLASSLTHCRSQSPSPPTSSFKGMFVFGSSLVDNGNNRFLASLSEANYTPYGIDFPLWCPFCTVWYKVLPGLPVHSLSS
ncbi:hypothetical protein SAY86_020993 [Trapa natans]|uniref:K-box domain-containing protein n=1 Tax=Trapa natans TaxID=22666 RepID=A0AAN7RJM0_TRANT|nr:hypothetical protein SAY86_020993 [Trapa natans]